jgi:sulfatase maturation enzyme AslB (radical SAM superfamily)
MSNTIDTNDSINNSAFNTNDVVNPSSTIPNFKFVDLRPEIKQSESVAQVAQTANCDECDCQDNCQGCDVENDIEEGEGVKMYDPTEFNAGAKSASWYAGFVDQMEEVGLSPEQAIEFLKHKMTIDEELEMTRQNNQVALRIAWKNFVDVEKEKF